jgi:hypothetical protein
MKCEFEGSYTTPSFLRNGAGACFLGRPGLFLGVGGVESVSLIILLFTLSTSAQFNNN